MCREATALLALVLLVDSNTGSSEPQLAPGARVRIRVSSGRLDLRGRLVSDNDSTLTIEQDGRQMTIPRPGAVLVGSVRELAVGRILVETARPAQVVEVPAGSVRKLEVSVGRRRRVGAGVLAGAASGVLASLVITGFDTRPCLDGPGPPCYVLASLVLAPAGAVAGGLLGLPESDVWRKTDGWPAALPSAGGRSGGVPSLTLLRIRF
jgi:hypothetical protein